MTEEQHKLILLEKEINNLDIQLKRFISHLDSEQRLTGSISKRVDTVEKMHEKHEEMLINNGKGIIFRVNNIEQREQTSKSNLTTWLSIVGFLMGLAALIKDFIR